MQFGIYVPTAGPYEVPVLVELAREAEAAGWEGFFIWDHLLWTPDGSGTLADTTVALTAIALATQQMRFGALVTALPRRRPWKFAKEMTTLDCLSGGRLVAGAGLGGRHDFIPVGEPVLGAGRAEMLDEALDVVTALWSGEPVTHDGPHFHLEGARITPAPIQRPRIPIWVGGFWPNRRPFRRAARWDGALPLKQGFLMEPLSPAELREVLDVVRRERGSDAPFDLVTVGTAADPDPGRVAECERAGATWWLEATIPGEEAVDDFRTRVQRGPPTR